jgi:hypothetical protein
LTYSCACTDRTLAPATGPQPGQLLLPEPLAAAAPPAATLVVAAPQLKPGRVFVVANLQGAYYTLLELLSRNKFDFRSDNLLHLGNLVALPAPLLLQQPAPLATSAINGPLPGQLHPGGPSRRLRNSAALLKLVRRHGALGPMGGNECLALLAAARNNCLRSEQQAGEQSRLAGLLAQQGAGRASAAARGRCSALSMQLAPQAVTAVSAAPQGPAAAFITGPAAAAPVSSLPRCASRTPAGWLGSDGSDSSSGDIESDDASEGEEDVEMVAAPMTPLRNEPLPAVFPSPFALSGSSASASSRADVAKAKGLTSQPAIATGSGGNSGGPWLDDMELTQLLSLPACIVLESYGVRLLHAGAPDNDLAGGGGILPGDFASDVRNPHHTLFSHRRAGAPLNASPAVGVGCATAALATGLSSCRDVVRFAVLPPLRTLQQKSPTFCAKVAAGMAPSRADLLLELFEEPLSELDA